MEHNKVFSPIADQGQLAHLSATHSNALVENPFDDTVEAATADEK
ncbi:MULTISPECIES: streptamidine family RiPP [unclassified Streptomyces]|nr:streptamidine family RiPP [Streptomyces sp. NBC_01716]